MKIVFVLLVMILKIALIQSSASADITIAFEEIKNAFVADLEVSKDDVVRIYLERGKQFSEGNKFLREKIIKQLYNLSGRNIFASHKLFETYNKVQDLWKKYLKFSRVRENLNGNFVGIQAAVLNLLDTKLTEFLASSNDETVSMVHP